jgi:hypothetical protein
LACPGGPHLSHGATYRVVLAWESLGSPSEVSWFFGCGMLKFLKNIVASTRGFGFKNSNFWGYFPGKSSQKPLIDCAGQGCCIISDYLIKNNCIIFRKINI